MTDTTSTRPQMPPWTVTPFRDGYNVHEDKHLVGWFADRALAQQIADENNAIMSRVRSTTGAETAWIIRLRELADAMLEAKTDRHCTGKIFVELSDVELLKNVASHLEVTTPREKP